MGCLTQTEAAPTGWRRSTMILTTWTMISNPSDADAIIRFNLNLVCTMFNVQYTMYNIQCTMYNVQCTMYNVQCAARTSNTYVMCASSNFMNFSAKGKNKLKAHHSSWKDL